MGSISGRELLGRYSARDFGLRAGTSCNRNAINNAITQANADGGGIVEIPGDFGTVYISGPILMRSNVELVIQRGVTIMLMNGYDLALVQSVDSVNGISNVRITGGGILDGNRANQGNNDLVPVDLGTSQQGIALENVTDLLIEGITVKSCLIDGLALMSCTRAELRGVKCTDNGRHGILLNGTSRSDLIGCRSYDNGKVDAAGTGDGVHLNNTSVDNNIVGLVAYDSAASNKLQGYGVREEALSSCNRNLVVGGALNGNLTGRSSFVGASSVDAEDGISVRAYNNANESILNTTDTALTFNAERWDSHAMHSVSDATSRLTCIKAGKYVIDGGVEFAANATGWRNLSLKVNGTTTIKSTRTPAINTGTDSNYMSVSTSYDLAVGDYVELIVHQTSGDALNVVSTGNLSPELGMTRLSI